MISNYVTKLKSSKQKGIATKTDTQINETKQRAQNELTPYMRTIHDNGGKISRGGGEEDFLLINS